MDGQTDRWIDNSDFIEPSEGRVSNLQGPPKDGYPTTTFSFPTTQMISKNGKKTLPYQGHYNNTNNKNNKNWNPDYKNELQLQCKIKLKITFAT